MVSASCFPARHELRARPYPNFLSYLTDWRITPTERQRPTCPLVRPPSSADTEKGHNDTRRLGHIVQVRRCLRPGSLKPSPA